MEDVIMKCLHELCYFARGLHIKRFVERFTYLGSDIHVSAGCESEVNRRLGSHEFTG